MTSCPCRIHRNNGDGISHCCDEHSSNVYILFGESPPGCVASGLSASTSSARSQRTRSKKAAERAAANSSSHRMRRRVEEAASSSGLCSVTRYLSSSKRCSGSTVLKRSAIRFICALYSVTVSAPSCAQKWRYLLRYIHCKCTR